MTTRVNPDAKVCNVCRDSLPLTDFYEGKNTCVACELDRQYKSGKLNINLIYAGWKR